MVSLVKFNYWFKFYVSIITCSGIVAIFFYKGLTRNPEIENTLSELCLISGDCGELGIPNMNTVNVGWGEGLNLVVFS